MKTLRLSQKYVALVSDKDYPRVAQYVWHALVRRRNDGTVINVYAGRSVYKETRRMQKQLLHRFILGVEDPAVEVDHKDRNGLHCQRINLRIATHAQNVFNVGLRKDNASGTKGVDMRYGKWRARISVEGKPLHLGYFPTKKLAAKTYREAAVKYHGIFAPKGKGGA